MGEKEVRRAMRHKDVLGAGARRREKLSPKDKIHTVMSEYKRGTLHSGSGAKVTKRKQAVAIALSEARRAGARIPEIHHSPDCITPGGQKVY